MKDRIRALLQRTKSVLVQITPDYVKRNALPILIIVMIATTGYVAYTFTIYSTDANKICTTCHNMQPFVQSLEGTPHGNFNCHVCHELTPGVIMEFWVQLTESPSAEEVKERARLNLIEPCLSCHVAERLATKGIHESHIGIAFKSNSCNICHNPHFEDELGASCVECHDYIDTVDEHLQFHEQALATLERGDPLVCAKCHSSQADTEIPPSPDCIGGVVSGESCFSCHEAPLDPVRIQGTSCIECHH